MCYMADMSSDVIGYTEPIISWVLSNNTQDKTGNWSPLQFGLWAKLSLGGVAPRKQYLTLKLLFWLSTERSHAAATCKNSINFTRFLSQIDCLVYISFKFNMKLVWSKISKQWFLSGLLRPSRFNSTLRLSSNLNRSNASMILQGQNKISDKQRNQSLVSVL